jgi:hypothetical protein
MFALRSPSGRRSRHESAPSDSPTGRRSRTSLGTRGSAKQRESLAVARAAKSVERAHDQYGVLDRQRFLVEKGTRREIAVSVVTANLERIQI